MDFSLPCLIIGTWTSGLWQIRGRSRCLWPPCAVRQRSIYSGTRRACNIRLAGAIPLAELPARLVEHMDGWNDALPPAAFRSWTQVISRGLACPTYQYMMSTILPLLGPGIKLFNPIAIYIKADPLYLLATKEWHWSLVQMGGLKRTYKLRPLFLYYIPHIVAYIPILYAQYCWL